MSGGSAAAHNFCPPDPDTPLGVAVRDLLILLSRCSSEQLHDDIGEYLVELKKQHVDLLSPLIEELGRLEAVGRPIVYGITFEFLQHFGLSSLEELPPLQPEESESLEAKMEQDAESLEDDENEGRMNGILNT